MGDGPVQEAAEDPNEVVETPRPFPGSGRNEFLDQKRCELVQVTQTTLVGEGEQQPQRRLFGVIFAAQSPLVSKEVSDGTGEILVQVRTSSPSPRATSRSASTATFA